MATLEDAVAAMIRRKVNAQGGERRPGEVGDEEFSRMAVGLEVRPQELRDHGSAMVNGLLQHAFEAHGGAIRCPEDLVSLWADGVLTGLVLAELRATERLREEGTR